MTEVRYENLVSYREYPVDEMRSRALSFYEEMRRRRTVRDFADRPVPREIIADCIRAAGTAPSGANRQPWFFVAVSDPGVKRQIRLAAEEVERRFYEEGGAPEYWLEDLAHLGTDADKPHLEHAPYLIVVFSQSHGVKPDGSKLHHYYVSESVGIAMGMLITAVHNAGLVSLTHTPKPMAFLRDLLGRPKGETPVLILAVGYPSPGAQVPVITKKELSEIAGFV
ncbi:MAG TPA: nitroreductase family protein [candidate division Zixibacteria bacterium]|nr:nitroreductase family protein [candidate division Zixibacteria bacterium]